MLYLQYMFCQHFKCNFKAALSNMLSTKLFIVDNYNENEKKILLRYALSL